MTEIKPKCYHCQTELEVSPPYFCNETCKSAYWHESPTGAEKKEARPIAEIQELLLKKAHDARAQQSIENRQKLHDELTRTYKTPDDPVDFMQGVVNG